MKWFTGKHGSSVQYGHISAQHRVGIFNFNLRAIKERKTLTLMRALCKLSGKTTSLRCCGTWKRWEVPCLWCWCSDLVSSWQVRSLKQSCAPVSSFPSLPLVSNEDLSHTTPWGWILPNTFGLRIANILLLPGSKDGYQANCWRLLIYFLWTFSGDIGLIKHFVSQENGS